MTPCDSVGQKWKRSLHVNSRRTSVLFPCGWLVFSDHWWGGDISGGTGKSGKKQQLIGVRWGGWPIGVSGEAGGEYTVSPKGERLRWPKATHTTWMVQWVAIPQINVMATAFLATLREHKQTMFAINTLFHLYIGLLRLQRSIRFNQSDQKNKSNQSQQKNEK